MKQTPPGTDLTKPRCTARSKAKLRAWVDEHGGLPEDCPYEVCRCSLPPVAGGTVCRHHGGKAPQVVAAAKTTVALERARVALGTYGVSTATELDQEEDVSPVTEYQRLAKRHRSSVEWLTGFISELSPAELYDVTVQQGTVPGVWLKLLDQEQGKLRQVLGDMRRYGIDEARFELDRAQVRLQLEAIAPLLQAVFQDADLALTDAQLRTLPTVLARHFQTG